MTAYPQTEIAAAMAATHELRERGMIFRRDEVPLVLSGQETMAREIIKGIKPTDYIENLSNIWAWIHYTDGGGEKGGRPLKLPYQPGDIIYIRETWCELYVDHRDYRGVRQAAYRSNTDIEGDSIREEYGYKWRSPVCMPRWAARPWRGEIITIRAERLQDISEADAIKEGVARRVVKSISPYDGSIYSQTIFFCDDGEERPDDEGCFATAKAAYENYWNRIHGPGSWDRNDYVWVREWKAVKS